MRAVREAVERIEMMVFSDNPMERVGTGSPSYDRSTATIERRQAPLKISARISGNHVSKAKWFHSD
jgi:hypothetical protein